MYEAMRIDTRNRSSNVDGENSASSDAEWVHYRNTAR
jgi:hypothetical protein